MKLLEIKSLNFSYGAQKVLENVSLSYDNKDFLAIIGPNGGGKSTLVKLILGILPLKKGIDKFISNTEISYVSQNTEPNLNFDICVEELVLMGLVDEKIFGFYSKKDREKAEQMLDKMGILRLKEKRVSQLSGGERQRAFIARALISDCKLLILDEPTASVDSKTAVAIFELLACLHAENIGIIVICHDINLALAYANKIAYLNKELVLHENSRQNSAFLKHLYENHSHFCDVEMSLKTCLCDTDNGLQKTDYRIS